MKLSVKTMREAGLEARWIKREGRPLLTVRNPAADLRHQARSWWVVTASMFKDMQTLGIVEAFDRHTVLGDIFSVTV